jgi:hypothetical protein
MMGGMSMKRAILILFVVATVLLLLSVAFGVATSGSGGVDPGTVVPTK